MKFKFLRSIAFILLFLFSFHQLSFAYPITSTAPTAQGIIHDPFLKLLKSDPPFKIQELTQADLDQIKARLLALITEDIHFGQSAFLALESLLDQKRISYSRETLTKNRTPSGGEG